MTHKLRSNSAEIVTLRPTSVPLCGFRTSIACAIFLLPTICCGQSRLSMPPDQLAREVVYNELHDHNAHGFWRYSIEQKVEDETRLVEQIETTDGPVARLLRSNGLPLDSARQQAEQARLDRLLSSPSVQARFHQQYVDDEKRVGRILAMFPDAFLFDYVGDEDGCHHLRFHPNPNYSTHTIESRIFHAMAGDVWFDARLKRLTRVEGSLQNNVDFGFGFLGRLNKGGWFRLDRTQVGPTEWKTSSLEVHLNGSAMLFKSIGRETSETRRDFSSVPPGLNIAQGIDLLRSQNVVELQADPALKHRRSRATGP